MQNFRTICPNNGHVLKADELVKIDFFDFLVVGKGGHVWMSLGSLGPRMTDAQNISMMRLAVRRRRLGAHHFTMQNMATQLRVAKYEAERLMFFARLSCCFGDWE